jgi:hypothetical protein
MDTQIRNSFDKATLKKIGKGALIATSAGASIALLEFVGTLQTNNPTLAVLIATLVPIAVNAIREWRAGEAR